MSDDLETFIMAQPPTPDRPLNGITVLVVEDSRFASEAIRLLCLRSGARIRRADNLAAAHRHLRVYRPSVVIIDMGLPDGSGADLIGELSGDAIRVPVILGMSGDAGTRNVAISAGADGFLEKPVESLATFQRAILDVIPSQDRPVETRALTSGVVSPDVLALQDDLSHMAQILRDGDDGATQDYVAQFLGGLALAAHDQPLAAAAKRLAASRSAGRATSADMAHVSHLLEDRLRERPQL
ncbi:Response regulator receiver domain-containing protein [Aliiroseovarius halocynthiae]|uniref:Response regulator n=1 Tax=Aliiroseovarius halocynthiae TaxID=985055 RepID=A0A545SZW5_9RHOB|nr:response regulator [Aliiroseovarius halocynthiae]TQV70469.1 response regulator [Aliiroseovarius halocynthiae]SMR81809.1 Response regulator receiver domain-containing protein [Aliiroseovarius halocynthiae]